MAMKPNSFTSVLRAIPKLTNNQLHIIYHRISSEMKRGGTDLLIDECKQESLSCPHCGCESVAKWGSANGLQRYKCKESECRKTFNALTKTPLARLRKRHLWQKNLDCMFYSLPIWKVSDYLGVAPSTAFRWRHRFLAAPTKDKPSEVAGIIEADEMVFLESYKGNQTVHNREPRKRGGLGDRKCKDDKIPVLIIRDRNGGLTDCVLENNTGKEISTALAPIINKESVLCTDGAIAYKSFAIEHGIKHYRNITSQGTRVIKRTYHIQNVNNYMSRLRSWMVRFRGVGTAYLANYLGWMRLMEQQNKNRTIELKQLLLANFKSYISG